MLNNSNSSYENLYKLERAIFQSIRAKLKTNKSKKRPNKTPRPASKLFSPWLIFWLTVGAFFFTFQTFLFFHGFTAEGPRVIELLSLSSGLLLALSVGIGVLSFSANEKTDWLVPNYIFLLWMLIPSLFAVVFLAGIFLQQPVLVDFQNSHWRSAIEFLLFGTGLLLIVKFYKNLHLTHGSLSIMLISLLFILKAMLTNSFYLSNKCPTSVYDDRLAWMSNTSEEIQVYRQTNESNKFYRSPFGQFVCTRTHEDLFR